MSSVIVICIIKVGAGNNRQFDLLKVIAVERREHNVDIESFAVFIRLRAADRLGTALLWNDM